MTDETQSSDKPLKSNTDESEAIQDGSDGGESQGAEENSVFDEDEHHPDEWPADATRDDYPDELPEPKGWHDEKGKPYDNNWRLYNPYQGSKTPAEGRCSAALSNWEERYGSVRYCMQLPLEKIGGDTPDIGFCHIHKQRQAMVDQAKELFTHGLYTKSIRHTLDKLPAWRKVVLLAHYDSYLSESHYDFDEAYQDHSIQFDGVDELPIEVTELVSEEGVLNLPIPVPNEHETRAFALFRAAIMDAKAALAESELLGSAMERETTVTVTENGEEITDMEEHHLNLPLSRLDKDRKELLAYGGVPLEDDNDGVEMNVKSPDSLIMDIGENNSPQVESDEIPIESAVPTEDEQSE